MKPASHHRLEPRRPAAVSCLAAALTVPPEVIHLNYRWLTPGGDWHP
jgi:hypothetical protein